MAYRLVTNVAAKLPGDYKRQPTGARGPNQYEEGFYRLWCMQFQDLPKPEREYRFHESRKWRLDFAWPDVLLGVEIDGQVHAIRGKRNRDAEKSRALVGWYVLHWTSDEIKADPVGCVETTAHVLQKLLDTKGT